MRLFIAAWPPPEVLDRIEALERPDVAGLRWSTRDQWHVTLRFLGELTGAASLTENLEAWSAREQPLPAANHPAEATLGPATAWFPGSRILQVPVRGLEELAREVNEATRSIGRAPERFSGHLTLARARGRGVPGSRARILAGVPIEARWVVDELAVVASTPTPSGSRYEVVSRVALHRS